MLKGNIKRGLLTGLVFSLVGFILPVIIFMSHDQTSRRILSIPCMPAEYILGCFMTTWEMGHGGGAILIPFVNTLLYGLIGCLISTFFDIRRYVIHFCVIIGILAVVSIAIINTRESLKRKQEIESMKVGYEHRLKTDPTEVHSMFWLGVHHFSRTRNYQEAKGYFEKILTLAPQEQYNAFMECRSLSRLTWPSRTTTVEENAFSYCHALADVTLPEGVSIIRDLAFRGCTKLTSITIPSTVTDIGLRAFADCPSLKEVYFQGNMPRTGANLWTSSDNVTVYYLRGKNGWGTTFCGSPIKISE